VAPFFTPEWGDIPAKRWRIHPRAKPVAFCCRGEKLELFDLNYAKFEPIWPLLDALTEK
jgi:hypothetical protein